MCIGGSMGTENRLQTVPSTQSLVWAARTATRGLCSAPSDEHQRPLITGSASGDVHNRHRLVLNRLSRLPPSLPLDKITLSSPQSEKCPS